MSKNLIAAVVAVVALGVGALIVAGSAVGFHNDETRLRNTVTAKQTANTTEFDNMWKKISQTAQVAEAQKNGLVEIFSSYASGRSSGEGSGQLMSWVQESVPNADLSTYEQVLNIITAARDTWTRNQKELVDLGRRHEDMISLFPGNVWAGIFNRESIDITVVTSTRTDEAFATGKDDDVTLPFGQ